MQIFLLADIPAHAEALIYPFSKSAWERFLQGNPQGIAGIPAAILRSAFSAEARTSFSSLQVGGSGQQIYLLGMGEAPAFPEYLRIFRSFFYKRREQLPASVAIDFRPCGEVPAARHLEALANGLGLSSYSLRLYKTEAAPVYPAFGEEGKIAVIPGLQSEELQNALELGMRIAQTQKRVFDLVNAPANLKTPAILASWAMQSAYTHGYESKALDAAQLKVEGLEALLAVGRGSEQAPMLIIQEYRGNPSSQAWQYGFVGKGVTFDTGGLSIKGSSNMHFMKSDMGGAAAVMGAIEVIAAARLPVNCVAIVPATENSVDARSTRPGDVIGSYAGKSIEVIDTDAEGRLILADGLAYCLKNYNPEVMIDAATLTGSCIQTLGYHAAGLFSNNDTLADRLEYAGRECGERLWRLPLWDVYKEDIQSDIADLKNYSGKPVAGAISAAKFLEVFAADHPSWAHLDIAGVAFSDSEYSTMRAATAYGVRLLFQAVRSEIDTLV